MEGVGSGWGCGELIMQNFMRYGEEFGFYSQCSGEPLKVFKQRSDMIRFAFWKRSLLQLRMETAPFEQWHS